MNANPLSAQMDSPSWRIGFRCRRTKKDELLAQLARAQGIDWGRSRAADGRIFDAWGTPVDVDYQFCGYHVMLRFRSAGPDKKLRTHDDVF
ncbi:hypothetical protein QPK87_11420 [Kamptonema cortianum]|nr:hypothetical protein [Kamptonema cortianum]